MNPLSDDQDKVSDSQVSDAAECKPSLIEASTTNAMKAPVQSEIIVPKTEETFQEVGESASGEPATGQALMEAPPPRGATGANAKTSASVASASDLLHMLAPDGPWNVRTISSLDGGSPQLPQKLGYRVGPDNVNDRDNGIYGWIGAAEAGLYNCYLHVAVGPAGKPKLSRLDVVGSRAAWVDIDPDPERFEESRADILAAMRAEEPPFSCIIDSGNGYQGYKFIEPYRMNQNATLITELERRNYAISESMRKRLANVGIKVDSCHSADHLMRLPDTTNFLTAKKRNKGYPDGDRPARIIDWHPERVYKLEELPAPTEEETHSGDRDESGDSITPDQLKFLLAGLDPKNYREGALWRSMLWASHHGTRGAGQDAFVEWSASDEVFAGERSKTVKAWARANDERSDGITVATLFHELKQAGRDDLVRKVRGLDKPYILFEETRLPEILDLVEAALMAAGVPIYQTGGRIVHPLRLDKASDDDGVRRSAGSLLLRSTSPLRLREYYLEHINFTHMITKRNGARVEVPYAPSVTLANHHMAREDKWGLPVVRGIVETPTLRADGTLVTAEGYDKAAELIVDLNGVEFPEIPDAPTKLQASAGLETIKQLLVGFPFVPDDESSPGLSASRSVALSAILSIVVRRTMRSAPLHGFSAPTMGTGKTLLADVVSMVGTGRLATAMSQGHDETEDEKRLLGVLMRSDPLLLIDNIHRPLAGDTLCTIMTQQTWQGRLLGENRQVHVPTNVLILATGNNLAVAGDMTTRTLISRLDAGVEQPEKRRFNVDLKVEIPRRRPELVVAILTVLRAFIAAGRPGLEDLEPFGRFEDWSNLVRGALVWLGEPDPCGTRSFIAERDPVRADLVTLVAAIESGVGPRKPFVSADLIKLSQEKPGLRNALEAIMPRGPSAKGLTSYLSGFDGRIVDGRCIRMSYDKHAKIRWFRLEAVSAAASQPEIPF